VIHLPSETPGLYAQEHVADPLVYAVVSHARLGWFWYILEYDPATRRAFALVTGFETELGYVWLPELEANGCYVLDLALPKPLCEVRALCELDEAA
jgi:hypothetical protein